MFSPVSSTSQNVIVQHLEEVIREDEQRIEELRSKKLGAKRHKREIKKLETEVRLVRKELESLLKGSDRKCLEVAHKHLDFVKKELSWRKEAVSSKNPPNKVAREMEVLPEIRLRGIFGSHGIMTSEDFEKLFEGAYELDDSSYFEFCTLLRDVETGLEGQSGESLPKKLIDHLSTLGQASPSGSTYSQLLRSVNNLRTTLLDKSDFKARFEAFKKEEVQVDSTKTFTADPDKRKEFAEKLKEAVSIYVAEPGLRLGLKVADVKQRDFSLKSGDYRYNVDVKYFYEAEVEGEWTQVTPDLPLRVSLDWNLKSRNCHVQKIG